MALSAEQIQKLLAQPEQPRRTGGRKKKNEIDTSVRDYATWFKLAQKMLDDNGENISCANPNCPDTRPSHKQLCSKVNGVFMCRRCFIDGYMMENPDQEKLDIE